MERELMQLFSKRASVSNITTDVEFNNLIDKLSIRLPDDYIEFLKLFNGYEGLLKDELYITLWSLDNLENYNEMYEVNEFAPEVFLIGSNGSGLAFGILKEDLSYIQIPFIGMFIEDAENLGENFTKFISTLLEKNQKARG